MFHFKSAFWFSLLFLSLLPPVQLNLFWESWFLVAFLNRQLCIYFSNIINTSAVTVLLVISMLCLLCQSILPLWLCNMDCILGLEDKLSVFKRNCQHLIFCCDSLGNVLLNKSYFLCFLLNLLRTDAEFRTDLGKCTHQYDEIQGTIKHKPCV